MRIGHRYLTWDSHTKTIKPLRSILDKFNILYKYKEDLTCVIPTFKHTLEFYLYEDNPNFHELKKEIDKYNVEPQIGTVYEKSDIDKAEWFIISTGEYQYPQPENDFGYLEATFYLDNYCRICGIGKLQNAPFRLKSEPKQYTNQFWGLHWEFESVFVRQETKSLLEKEQIKGIQFSQPVLHKKNAPIDGLYQLHIDSILPKGFDNYNTQTITCKINNEEGGNTDPNCTCCGRIKFHHPMVGGYLFDSKIFDTEFDIVNSFEYFGSGGSANRHQVVSKRFKQIVDKNKLKGLKFTPVVHERLKR
jgi:hypothetical protein